jgi:hypothetical protein
MENLQMTQGQLFIQDFDPLGKNELKPTYICTYKEG